MSGFDNSAHLTQFSRADMIEQYGGAVEMQFAKDSFMRQFADIRAVRGTDTLVDRRMGRTTVQRVTEGVRPEATPTNFGKVTVTVDTICLARANRALLNDLQTDFDARTRLGYDHGKELGKLFDQSFLIQVIKGSMMAAPENLNGAFGAGKNVKLAAANDEKDPDKLVAAIKEVIQKMREEEVDTEEMVILVRPTEFDTLLDNDKLVDREFSDGNGDYAKRALFYLGGVRIMETARIPNVQTPAGTHHILSNSGNGYAYDLSADEAKAKAVIMHPRSLLAGETIPLTSDMYYNREELQWYIDSYMAFGVSVNRPDLCGCVFAAE